METDSYQKKLRMDVKMIARNVAEKMRLGIRAHFESADSYDILGVVEYAFYDGSVIQLQGVYYDETPNPIGDVSEALRRIGTFALIKSKVKCMNLPTEWNPS
jgi:hypothetical protein